MGNAAGAVIYVRVSTDEQADGALNLSNQEQKCRTYCDQKDFAVLQVFVDPGESARTADRPEFQRMLAYCKAHREEIGYIVVQDLSRFARNNGDQARFIAELGKFGVRLCSVYEPNVDDTAAGKLAANIHGTFNQYFSDALSDKMKDRTRAAVLAGRFPWPAPIGYLNDSKSRTGANLIPDPQRGPLVRRAFELIATGRYRKVEVLQIVTAEGLRTRKGKQLSAQTFEAMLKKPIYCGCITASCLNEPAKGLYEPIVSEQLFQTVQAVLSGKRLTVAPKRKHNPNLPLKWFVRCDSCGTPLTGGLVTGKNKNKKLGYYWCRKSDCRSTLVRKEELEALLVNDLRRLRPDDQTVADFPKVAERVWTERQGNAAAKVEKLRDRLEEQKAMKSALLRAKLCGEVSQADYAYANNEFDREIGVLTECLKASRTSPVTLDAFLRFAKTMVVDIAGAWQRAGAEHKISVQNLLFQNGLRYSQELRKFEHPKPCLFSMVEELGGSNWWLASPTGFEPVLPP
jgi:DNA invertase Pin-like site-specific DNA recombinase